MSEYASMTDEGQAGTQAETSPSPWPAVPAERRAADRRWGQAEIDRLSGP